MSNNCTNIQTTPTDGSEPQILLYTQEGCNGTPIALNREKQRGAYQDSFDFAATAMESSTTNRYIYGGNNASPQLDGLLNLKSIWIPPHMELDYSSNINFNTDARDNYASLVNNGTYGSGAYPNIYLNPGKPLPWGRSRPAPIPFDNSVIEYPISGMKFSPTCSDPAWGANAQFAPSCIISKACCKPVYDTLPAVGQKLCRLFTRDNIPATCPIPSTQFLYTNTPRVVYKNRPRSIRMRQLDTWDNFKVKCCRASSDYNADTCGIYWGPNGDNGACDDIMTDWCSWNPEDRKSVV